MRGYNIFFEGQSIYSHGHHFKIAKRINIELPGECPSLTRCIMLLTAQTYSVPTTQHVSMVRHACAYNCLDTYEVPNVDATDHEAHVANQLDMIARRDAMLVKADRARTRQAFWIDQAKKLEASIIRYGEIFALTPIHCAFDHAVYHGT